MIERAPVGRPRAGVDVLLLGIALAWFGAARFLAAQEPHAGALPGVPPEAQAASSPDAAPGVLAALPVEGEIRLDGILGERAWADADPAGDFRQQDPDEGQPATFPTWVRVLFSRDRLYIGARMEDPAPERLIARILERDELLEQGFFTLGSYDDAFLVVLDTYDDDRNGFLFATNPNGAETDALLRNEADLNVSWDAVWSVATAVDSAGWTAEIEIPIWTLRFAETGVPRWGVNFQRVLKRRNETDLWRSWTRDNGGLLKVSQAGSLEGLGELDQGLNLQVKPFILAEGRRERPLGDSGLLGEADDDGALDAGIDAKFGVTPNLTLDATLNTDFAQVEADIRQINLTRFSLFFPEKREFFLEGAGIFDFGIPGFGGPPSILLFFSRRIGIELGREIPILAGGKLTGKEGPYSIGLLEVVTGDEGEVPRTNFAVARATLDVGARSRLGAIATHRAPAGGAASASGGVDAHVQISQKMAFDAFAAASDAPGTRGETAAYRAALDFTADQWGWLAEQAFIGPGFEPTLGFVLRDDINRQFGTFRVTPRPPVLDIRRIDLRVVATLISNADWRIRDREYRFTATPQLNSGDGLELGVTDRFERLPEPFVLSPEVVFPGRDYETSDWDARLFTSRNRVVSGEVLVGRLGFFSGRNRIARGILRVAANRHLSFEGFWDHNVIESPDGDLTTDLAYVRVNYAISTRFFTSALVQYDSLTDEIDANVRVNLIHSPGSDLFIVLNERRGEAGDLSEVRNRALVVKFTKLFNL